MGAGLSQLEAPEDALPDETFREFLLGGDLTDCFTLEVLISPDHAPNKILELLGRNI
ncbi:MAG: hypothetical protein JWO78_1115 [Micavibrio sp.]|nr:hypothetical protein [Micavibrio sp.]